MNVENKRGMVMQVSRYSMHLKVALLTQLALFPGASFAQTIAAGSGQAATPPATDTTDTTGAIGEIVVTAQRRSESLQRVPLTVSVVSADAIAKQNITTESDLQFAAPV